MSGQRIKKILHFIDSDGLYGAESVILNLSHEMSVDSSFLPIIGCILSHPEDKCDLFEEAIKIGFEAEKIIIRNSIFIIDIFKIAKRFKKLNISLIHSHGYKPSVFAFLLRLLTGIPVLSTCHLWFLQDKIPLKMKAMIKIELFLYKFFPVVVAVSDSIKNTLKGFGILEDRIKVIKNGIEISDYTQISIENTRLLKKQMGIKEDSLIAINVARLAKQKAQWNIIKVAKILKIENIKVKFFIVGEGPLKNYLQKMIDDLVLNDYVHLLGFRNDIHQLLQIADIFLLPSIDEGMPMALLEAVASKVAVIVTPVGDIPKLIQDGTSGVVVKVDDLKDLHRGMRHITSSEAVRQNMSKNAFVQLCKEYSAKNMYFML